MERENIKVSRPQFATKSSNQKRFNSIEETLKPIIVSLKIFGIYFDPTPAGNKIRDSSTMSPVRKTSILSRFTFRMYSIIVLILLWFNFIRCAVGLLPVDDGLSYRVTLTSWYLQCAINATIMYASCHRLRHFRSFYKHWNSLFLNSVTQDIGCGFRSPSTCLKAATVIGWIFFLVNNITLHSVFFCNLPQTRDLVVNVIRPFPEENWSRIIITILQCFETAAWVFPVVFFCLICRIIQVQFFQFRSCLSKQIDEADGRIPDRLSELRSRYTQLCHAVDLINDTYKWILGMSFFLEIFLSCFLSYLLINNSPDIINIIINTFWLLASILVIVVLTISSYNVHEAAHSLLGDIFRVGTRNATAEQLGQLNLFVAKLTGTSIGFTAIDFFVVTKDFLLTLGGLYVTYFFLLLQFKID